jgi:subtilisin family serine protease
MVSAILLLGALPALSGGAAAGGTRYIVVFAGTHGAGGRFEIGGSYAQHSAAAFQAVTLAGGVIANNLARDIGVVVAESSHPAFADRLRESPLVQYVGADFSWKGIPGADEMPAALTTAEAAAAGGGPEQTQDPLEAQQWDMLMIRAPKAHDKQAGWDKVDVGVLDSGIDGTHLDFDDDGLPGGETNVDCARGRNSVVFLPGGPGAGNPNPCVDNGFHGTHVAGTIAAQANGIGIVGVAPNVTLVPVKVCDSSGYCYASAVVDGITYAGQIQLDVINMSFFVDDDEVQESTEFKCPADEQQMAYRTAVERALLYARSRGTLPVAALGNSDVDLANPPAPFNNECNVVPAESPGVVGVVALGRQSQKSSYSSYGYGEADVAAPGGDGATGDCLTTILSTFPGNAYGCIQGTSMASPHAAGVAALIVSQFGTLGADGDVKYGPTNTEQRLRWTTVDIGRRGYDECFGQGRINAVRAVWGISTKAYESWPPFCPEYGE